MVQVRQKYGLTIDRREAAALEQVLQACPTTQLTPGPCEWSILEQLTQPDFSGPWKMLVAVWRAIAPYLGW